MVVSQIAMGILLRRTARALRPGRGEGCGL